MQLQSDEFIMTATPQTIRSLSRAMQREIKLRQRWNGLPMSELAARCLRNETRRRQTDILRDTKECA